MSKAREFVWSSDRVGMDGLTYSVSYFGTEEHIRQLQRVGLAPKNLDQVIGLERVADEVVASLEAGMHTGAVH